MTFFPPLPLRQLSQRASDKLQGIGWVAGSTWASQAVRLATLAILANFFPPDTFGFFAFALAMLTILQPVIGLGLSGALVVKPKLAEDDLANCVLLSILAAFLGMALALAGLMVAMML